MKHPTTLFAFKVEVAAATCGSPHRHPCVEVLFTGESSGWIGRGDRTWRFEPGQVFVHQPVGPHWARVERGGAHLCVGIVGERAESLAEGTFAPEPPVSAAFEAMHAALAHGGPWQAERIDLIAGLLTLELYEQQQRSGLINDHSTAGQARRARDLINQDYAELNGVADLADRLFVSPAYLRELFKREFGVSPVHYLIRRRMEAAQQMLRLTDWPIRLIAARCGFASPHHFSRTFHKVTGRTPTCYREQR